MHRLSMLAIEEIRSCLASHDSAHLQHWHALYRRHGMGAVLPLMSTNSYLEFFLTLLGWIINNGIWNETNDLDKAVLRSC